MIISKWIHVKQIWLVNTSSTSLSTRHDPGGSNYVHTELFVSLTYQYIMQCKGYQHTHAYKCWIPHPWPYYLSKETTQTNQHRKRIRIKFCISSTLTKRKISFSPMLVSNLSVEAVDLRLKGILLPTNGDSYCSYEQHEKSFIAA